MPDPRLPDPLSPLAKGELWKLLQLNDAKDPLTLIRDIDSAIRSADEMILVADAHERWHSYTPFTPEALQAIPNPVYVNVYRRTREYGGPEEGGWYYTQLTPVMSIFTFDDAELVHSAYRAMCDYFREDSYDYLVRMESDVAELSPACRPYYQ